MHCLVTGASGHLGSAVVRYLLAHRHRVTAMVRPESDLWRLADIVDRIELVRADITDLAPIRKAIIASSPDAVVHTAWFGVSSNHWNDPRQISANVLGTLDLVTISQDAGVPCWAGVGSQAEYGPTTAILTEDSPTRPMTAYGVAKLAAGLLTQKMCELAGIRHLWFRLFATYGPQDDARHLIPTVMRTLLAGERPSLTAGEQRWDYIYVDDAAEAIYRGVVDKAAHGTFNIGSGKAQSIRCLVESIRDLIDPSLPVGFGDMPYAIGQVMHLEADISRLKAATGWEPKTSLDVGVRRTLAWHQQSTSPTMALAQKG